MFSTLPVITHDAHARDLLKDGGQIRIVETDCGSDSDEIDTKRKNRLSIVKPYIVSQKSGKRLSIVQPYLASPKSGNRLSATWYKDLEQAAPNRRLSVGKRGTLLSVSETLPSLTDAATNPSTQRSTYNFAADGNKAFDSRPRSSTTTDYQPWLAKVDDFLDRVKKLQDTVAESQTTPNTTKDSRNSTTVRQSDDGHQRKSSLPQVVLVTEVADGEVRRKRASSITPRSSTLLNRLSQSREVVPRSSPPSSPPRRGTEPSTRIYEDEPRGPTTPPPPRDARRSSNKVRRRISTESIPDPHATNELARHRVIGRPENKSNTPLVNQHQFESFIDTLDDVTVQVREVEEKPRAGTRSRFADCVTLKAAKPMPADLDGKIAAKGKRTHVIQKHIMQATQLGINGFFIFATWWWSRYYYILLPFITATVALNVIMVFSLIVHKIWFSIFPEKKYFPDTPESLVLLMPCYNETLEEMSKSLDSLVAQQHISQHKQAIMIVCDGKVRGPGMEKTSADYLLEDILIVKDYRKMIRGAYLAWDQQPMDVVLQKGNYKGLPYICIIKQQNQGKRDSLIVARSVLFNYNRRTERPATVFSPTFFSHIAEYLADDARIDHVDALVGMDADTLFDKECISELLEESRYKDTVGVCGYVAVDGKENSWNPWRVYQSSEYTIAQCLRRLHQSMVTNKVSCLPGCCQLLKIQEETCGDHVLVDRFGYCPRPDDSLLKQIRATASEDRNHVCIMLSQRPKARTRQALKAKAYTDVPQTSAVFLSQRRRWTLGATSNDLLLMHAPGVQWFERIIALVNVITWYLNPFIFASLASFIFAILTVPVWIIMCFVAVMVIPMVYYVFIPFWFHKTWKDRFLFWAGCFTYIFAGPFINIAVLVYACFYMDSFGWGKTRKVVAGGENAEKNYEESIDARRPMDGEVYDSRRPMDEESRIGL